MDCIRGRGAYDGVYTNGLLKMTLEYNVLFEVLVVVGITRCSSCEL